MEVHAGKSLGNILDHFNPEYIEERKEMEKINPQVSDLFTLFETLLKKYSNCLQKHDSLYKQNFNLPEISPIVSPVVIQALAFALPVDSDEAKNFFPAFITRLMQNSYDAGFNNFYLDLREKPELKFLGSNLKGRAGKKLKLTVSDNGPEWWWAQNVEHVLYHTNSTAGLGFASRAKYSHFIVPRGCNLLGYEAEHCYFEISESGGYSCLRSAKNSIVIVHNRSILALENSYGQSAVYSTFKTPDEKTLQEFLRDVPDNNQIIMIEKNGSEKIIRKCPPAP